MNKIKVVLLLLLSIGSTKLNAGWLSGWFSRLSFKAQEAQPKQHAFLSALLERYPIFARNSSALASLLEQKYLRIDPEFNAKHIVHEVDGLPLFAITEEQRATHLLLGSYLGKSWSEELVYAPNITSDGVRELNSRISNSRQWLDDHLNPQNKSDTDLQAYINRDIRRQAQYTTHPVSLGTPEEYRRLYDGYQNNISRLQHLLDINRSSTPLPK